MRGPQSRDAERLPGLRSHSFFVIFFCVVDLEMLAVLFMSKVSVRGSYSSALSGKEGEVLLAVS